MHVLITDDEPKVRELLVRFLTDAGHEIKEAGTAQEAIESMAASPAGVALCDIQMPGEHDGIWLTHEIRKRHHATAVVLVTGVDSVPPSTSMQAGVVAYIVKPFSSERVLAAVKQAIAWHEEAVTAGPQADRAAALEDWFAQADEELGL